MNLWTNRGLQSVFSSGLFSRHTSENYVNIRVWVENNGQFFTCDFRLLSSAYLLMMFEILFKRLSILQLQRTHASNSSVPLKWPASQPARGDGYLELIWWRRKNAERVQVNRISGHHCNSNTIRIRGTNLHLCCWLNEGHRNGQKWSCLIKSKRSSSWSAFCGLIKYHLRLYSENESRLEHSSSRLESLLVNLINCRRRYCLRKHTNLQNQLNKMINNVRKYYLQCPDTFIFATKESAS